MSKYQKVMIPVYVDNQNVDGISKIMTMIMMQSRQVPPNKLDFPVDSHPKKNLVEYLDVSNDTTACFGGNRENHTEHCRSQQMLKVFHFSLLLLPGPGSVCLSHPS